MLGIALHPRYPDRALVYVYATRTAGTSLRNQILRFRDDDGSGVGRRAIFSSPASSSPYHNGGRILFGPDGKLYAIVGDGHGASNSQDLSNDQGKILRLEPNGEIPRTNPFGDRLFAYGIRNSFGFAFDPETERLWETENGPSGWDEINRIEPGGNYGWPAHLGPGGGPAFVEPVLAFEETIVPTGCAGSAYAGGLYFGEGYTGNLHRMVISGPGKAPRDTVIATFEGGITDVALDPTGALILVTPNAIYRGLGGVVGAPATTSGVSMRPTPSPSPSTGGPFAALGTGVGLLVAVVLAAFILWYRGRANR